MDLSDLQIFRSVVKEGGITRAAEKLNRVQSNITTRVRQLEEDLGVALFIREGKRMQPSPAGKLLLDYADRLLDLAQEARDAIHDAAPRGLLRLGSIESTAAIRLPAPMHEFHLRYPDVRFELVTAGQKDLTGGVMSGELDAALLPEPITGPFDKALIYDEELVIVAPFGHPPIHKPRDAKTKTMLAFEYGCPYRMRMEQWFAIAGEVPEKTVEMSSWHAILGCTAAGMGISVLPRMVLASFPQQMQYFSVHPLPAGIGRAPTMLIWRKGATSPNVRALRELLTAPAAVKPERKKAMARAS